MAALKGLWSYVHSDDTAEGGRIAELARDVAGQFEMLTGEQIDLFLDKDALEWGDVWRDKIDESLATIAFFIPVMTPRYFMSAECRREFQYFARRATNLGVKELVLPLLYINVRELHEDNPEDDMVGLIRTFQWADWTDLRFRDRSSEAYRREVAAMAGRLVEANEKASETSHATVVPPVDEGVLGEPDEAAGVLDLLAASEKAIPEWTATTEAAAAQIDLVGSIMTEATSEIERADSKGKGFAGRLVVTKRAAERLREPAEQIWSLGNDFASQLHQVDEGIRIMVGQIAAEVADGSEHVEEYREFFDTIRTLATSTKEGLESAQGFLQVTGPIEAMSRDLRAPLRRLRQGITLMLEAQEVAAEWVELIDKVALPVGDTGVV